MRTSLVALFVITALAAAPGTAGHDADAIYDPELIVIMGDGSGSAQIIMTMPGWNCTGLVSTLTALGAIHETTCAPNYSVPGFFPGCNNIYAGAIAWVPTPGIAMTHFPRPSTAPVGTLQVTTSCMLGGFVQDDHSVTTFAPGIAFTGKDMTSHTDGVRCVIEETWFTGTNNWVGQCAVNGYYVG